MNINRTLDITLLTIKDMDVLEISADENAKQMLTLLQDYLINVNDIPVYLNKMATEYIVVDDIACLEEGRFVRWIFEGKMTRGGFVLKKKQQYNAGLEDDVLDETNGIDDYVLCKTAHNRIVQFHFDECPCFQKLNMFEQWYMLHNTKKEEKAKN